MSLRSDSNQMLIWDKKDDVETGKPSEAVTARKGDNMTIQSTVDLCGSEIFYMILQGWTYITVSYANPSNVPQQE